MGNRNIDRCCPHCGYLILGFILAALLTTEPGFSQFQTFRTAGATKTLVFEPAEFHLGPNFGGAQAASDTQAYKPMVKLRQRSRPNPNPDPDKGLLRFLAEMDSANIGLLYIHTHGYAGDPSTRPPTPPAIDFEYYSTVEACTSAYYDYLRSGFDPDHLSLGQTVPNPAQSPSDTIPFYGIGLSPAGIDFYCNNLGGTMVYVDACHSYKVNGAWGALVALGKDTISGSTPDTFLTFAGPITSIDGTDRFFGFMTGLLARPVSWDSLTARREAHQAAPFSFTKWVHVTADSGDTTRDTIYTHLICQGDSVVLSPLVIDHHPSTLGTFIPGENGFVVFDCEMDYEHVAAKNVVGMTGTTAELTNVGWESPYAIKFTLPELIPGNDQYCVLGFQVDPDSARSRHNKSKLDGNSNPDNRNGVGPNGDPYSWYCAADSGVLKGFFDFEDGLDGQPIQNKAGLIFLPDSFDVWRYGDRRTGNYNVYPWSDYYWCDGNFFAGIPYTDTYAIECSLATARSFCLGASTNSEWLYLSAWDSTHALVDQDSIPRNSKKLTLDLLHVQGDRIKWVSVHGEHNSFLVDNLAVFDLPSETAPVVAAGYDFIINGLQPLDLQGSVTFPFTVPEYAESLQVVVNTLPEEMPEGGLHILVYDPDNNPFVDKEIGSAPYVSDRFAHPDTGGWEVVVSAVQSQEGSAPICVISASENAPRVDCYVQDGGDIQWYPSLPDSGDLLDILVAVHCNDSLIYSIGPEFVAVRCYLNGVGGEQINSDNYIVSLQPSEADSAYFLFNTKECELGQNYYIYVKVDPDNQLEEYNELNNIAYKQIVFGE